MSREEQERQEADDFCTEHGPHTSPAEVRAREQDEQERQRIAHSAEVLAVLMEEQVALYRLAAERAGETDSWTDRWIGHDGKPFSGVGQDVIDFRRQRAEQFREDAAIHRRRADALADGISAITGKRVDWFEGGDDGR